MSDARVQKLETALRALLGWSEVAAVALEREFGGLYSMAEMEAAGRMPWEITAARKALEESE